jgi:photosystem II stability/assembly factor-like uncharacterized protein
MSCTPASAWWRSVIAAHPVFRRPGTTWTQASAHPATAHGGVFVDDKHGWAVGHDAQILASRTAAHLDQAIRRPQARSAAARCLVQGRQHGFAVGAYGALLETTDGGKHWEDVSERLDKTSSTSTPSPRSRMPACSSSASRAACSAPPTGPDLGKTRRPLRGLAVRRDRHRPGQHPAGLRPARQPVRSTDFGSTWQQVELKAARGAWNSACPAHAAR